MNILKILFISISFNLISLENSENNNYYKNKTITIKVYNKIEYKCCGLILRDTIESLIDIPEKITYKALKISADSSYLDDSYITYKFVLNNIKYDTNSLEDDTLLSLDSNSYIDCVRRK